jgi:hypothetical protein
VIETDATDQSKAFAEFEQGMDLAIQGNAAEALIHFKAINTGLLSDSNRTLVHGFLERFESLSATSSTEVDNELERAILSAYHQYWKSVMLRRISAEEGEKLLIKSLSSLVDPKRDAPAQGMDDLEPILKLRLLKNGIHSSFGRTSPFRECMLWRNEVTETHTVSLPEGTVVVQVSMLDGFLSLGWQGYATGGYYHRGKWSTSDHLYCAASEYGIDSEAFRISFLAHESQHFLDLKRFPGLPQADLEYRAKLVEIIQSERTLMELLGSFGSNRSNDELQAHDPANRRLIHDLKNALAPNQSYDQKWSEGPGPIKVRQVALKLLRDDSKRLLEGWVHR